MLITNKILKSRRDFHRMFQFEPKKMVVPLEVFSKLCEEQYVSSVDDLILLEGLEVHCILDGIPQFILPRSVAMKVETFRKQSKSDLFMKFHNAGWDEPTFDRQILGVFPKEEKDKPWSLAEGRCPKCHDRLINNHTGTECSAMYCDFNTKQLLMSQPDFIAKVDPV